MTPDIETTLIMKIGGAKRFEKAGVVVFLPDAEKERDKKEQSIIEKKEVYQTQTSWWGPPWGKNSLNSQSKRDPTRRSGVLKLS